MNYLSICSGIEAASVAWESLGWKPLAFSEIEPFPRAVLAHHYPDVPLHGDFTKLRDMPFIADADVLVGGTPCQAFSVAGLRKSLDDDRGNLSLEFVRLADAIDDVRLRAGKQPAVILWENVPGVLSVRDNAFGCFLSGLAGEDEPFVPPRGKWTNAGVVAGPSRAVAWRILDAQYFGLAQRRRRVFVVASSREGFDPAAVLLEWEGMRRDTAPRREAGEGTAHATAPCLTSSGRGVERTGDTRGQDPVVAVTTEISHCLNAGGMGRQDYETETLVAHTLRGEGFDASEDGTGRGTPLVPVSVSHTLQTQCGFATEDGTGRGSPLVPVAFPANLSGTQCAAAEDIAPSMGAKNPTAVAIPLQEVGKRTGVSTDDPRAGIGIGQEGDPMFTLQAGAQHGVAAYAFQPRIARNGRGDMGDIVNALNAQSGETGKGDAAPCVAVAGTICKDSFTGGAGGRPEGAAAGHFIPSAMAVRRLTPVECERLQGFPDNYTAIPWRGKPAADCPDGPRYKALGNSMAVPCMAWIGRRIAEHLNRED